MSVSLTGEGLYFQQHGPKLPLPREPIESDGLQLNSENQPDVPDVTVVLPTYNECANIAPMVDRLVRTLDGIAWEAIFVDDDSPDGTAERVRQISQEEPRVRCIRRIGRRGLSGACIEGILASSSEIVAVMDADLQHDETLLPKMFALISQDEADLVVASRYVDGGAAGEGLSSIRQKGSEFANYLARRLLGVSLSDPMSGFFMIRRAEVETVAPRLSSQGFKILLDIVATSKSQLRLRELPFTFREREHGESKLDTMVTIEYLGLLISKMFGDLISVRFLLFSLVGATGVVVHLVSLRTLLVAGALPFERAQLIATFIAMTSNFFLNNQMTYRDRRLRGAKVWRGLFSFYLVCSIGVLANVGVASWIYGSEPVWWFAGTAGALMGAVWNYAASSVLTWRK
ncbi:MAG: glycosyltransferase family 2 protein [Stappiaceae bacterium]